MTVFRTNNMKNTQHSIYSSIRPIARKLFSNIYMKIGITLLILYYLYRQVDLQLLIVALEHVRYPYIPLLICNIFIFWGVNVLSFYFLLAPIGNIDVQTFFTYQFKSILLGSITPMQIGETAIFMYLKKRAIPVQKTLLTFLLNKLIHAIFMFLVGSIFLYYLQPTFFIIASVGGLAGLLSLITLFNMKPLRRMVRESVIGAYMLRYEDFFEFLAEYFGKHSRYLLLNILVNFLKILIAGFMIWLTFFLFCIKNDFWLLLSVYNLSRILTLLPISIGGLGVLEGGVALALSRIGYPYSVVVLAMFFLRILAMTLAFLTLLYFYFIPPHERTTA